MNPDFHVQVYLDLEPLFASSTKPGNIWLQYLLDAPLKVFFTFFKYIFTVVYYLKYIFYIIYSKIFVKVSESFRKIFVKNTKRKGTNTFHCTIRVGKQKSQKILENFQKFQKILANHRKSQKILSIKKSQGILKNPRKFQKILEILESLLEILESLLEILGNLKKEFFGKKLFLENYQKI